MEGHPCPLLHVSVLLQRPQPEGGSAGGETHGGGEGTLRVQVCRLPTVVSVISQFNL